jgi:carboxyl-terminal processing protease
MKYYLYTRIILPAIVVVTILCGSCSKEAMSNNPLLISDTSLAAVNDAAYSIMKDWYLWNDKMPEIDAKTYPTIDSLLNVLRYKLYDRWSFIMKKDKYVEEYVKGNMYGHGFGYAKDITKRIRVAYVYKSSALYKAGIRRSWIIDSINGAQATPDTIQDLIGKDSAKILNTFVFRHPTNPNIIIRGTFQKEVVKMNMVLSNDTFHIGDNVVGYVALKGFISDAEYELDSTFEAFKMMNVKELVVDLRYNSGGDLNIVTHLAGLIGGESANGKVFVNILYNNNHSDINETKQILSIAGKTLSIGRVFFITSNLTASASEALINGLKPHMGVYLIGGRTGGKPVGMNIFEFKKVNYILAPITFKLTNSLGSDEYYNGFNADTSALDDVRYDFGDRREACLKQALQFIQNGSFANNLNSNYLPQRTAVFSDDNIKMGTYLNVNFTQR